MILTQQQDADAEEIVVLDLNSTGTLFASSQVVDYMCRGEELEDHNVFEFISDTYEEKIPRRMQEQHAHAQESEPDSYSRGRPANERIRYMLEHPKQATVWRVKRSLGHNNLVNVIGKWFPRNDDHQTYPYYCACMLLLLKPWRKLSTDLKQNTETWEEAFERFSQATTTKNRRILSNIQYFHACETAAEKGRESEDVIGEGVYDEETNAHQGEIEMDREDEDMEEELIITEEHIKNAETNQESWRDVLHGRQAIATAEKANIFSTATESWTVKEHTVHNATGGDLQQLAEWRLQMKGDVARQNAMETDDQTPGGGRKVNVGGSVRRLEAEDLVGRHTVEGKQQAELAPERPLEAVGVAKLNAEQFQAYDIIQRHLQLTLQGKAPPPLRMITHGEGGTGKSQVIQTSTNVFHT
jgi:hypothetical protein